MKSFSCIPQEYNHFTDKSHQVSGGLLGVDTGFARGLLGVGSGLVRGLLGVDWGLAGGWLGVGWGLAVGWMRVEGVRGLTRRLLFSGRRLITKIQQKPPNSRRFSKFLKFLEKW